ncbi:MAG: hypothetical protein KAT00_09835 [Planctomycetes bacterium]|nr:hypothetical protein [Planctomycetota bacterium]
MKKASLCPIIIVVLTITLIGASGCATTGANRVQRGTDPSLGSFDRLSAKDIYITDLEAFRDGDGVMITGKVKRGQKNCCRPARGHVDIAVLTPDGMLLDIISTGHTPHNIPKVRSKSASFEAKMPYIPPENAIIRITYHDSILTAGSSAYGNRLLTCEKNIAQSAASISAAATP